MNTKYTAANADKNEYFAVAYYRLSKDDKAKSESDSIANQRKLISSYVDSHSNIKLVEEHYDDGYTGTNFDRPGFRAVMAAIKERNVNCVIVKDLSRLGREYIEMPTVVTRGKLEMYNKMEKPLPQGWALGANGQESTDAPDVLANIVAKKGGGIMPLGGNKEVNGSHKGYGYGMLCEIFSSIFSMGVTSDKCCTFKDKTGICHGFAAIDPAIFGNADDIRAHFSEYLETLRQSPKAEGAEQIYTHGEKEVFAEKERRENGIPVNDNTMVELANLCNYLKVDFGSYFKGYELPKDSKFFSGNY